MLGRFYTAAFTQVQNAVDPFAGDTVAALRSVAMHAGIGLGDVRFSNGIRYDFTSGGLTAAFKSLTQIPRPAHKRWTDAFLAAFAQRLGSEVVTFDSDLTTFPGVTVRLLTK